MVPDGGGSVDGQAWQVARRVVRAAARDAEGRNTLPLKGLQLDAALRYFLSTFKLPGEAQQIDRSCRRSPTRGATPTPPTPTPQTPPSW